VSLNPVPHIQREPWGMVVFPILSLIVTHNLFGWPARRTIPFGSGGIRGERLDGAGGPATNYTLMLLAAVALRVGWTYHWLRVDETNGRADFPTSVLAFSSF